MAGTYIDLYQYPFWLTVLAALILLTPLSYAPLRKWVLAFINTAFLWHLLGHGCVYIALGVLALWVLLFLLSRGRWQLLCLAVCIGGSLALFILNKLPDISDMIGFSRLNPIMSAMGFSYVFLRLNDLFGAVAEHPSETPSIVNLVNYLFPFHMLAAGPIQSYDDFVNQPAVPPPSNVSSSLIAVERITFGLFKKFVVANILNTMFLTGFQTEGLYFFLEVQLFFLWLYLDFSAYSDVAVGTGQLIGVATPENFNRPYFARNMIEFWERWHITLGQFIRRNIFIPLQLFLQRKLPDTNVLVPASLSFIVSFLLCGLWHEISWRYFVWGAFHAIGLVVCNLYRHFLQKRLGRAGVTQYLQNRWIRVIAIVVTYEYVAFSLVFVGEKVEVF